MGPDSYSNHPERIEQVRAWREAAIADGWHADPIYPGFEPIEAAARLTRDGWTVQVYARDRGPEATREPRFKGYVRYEADVAAWGPDGMAVKVARLYDWPAMQAGLRRCGYCKATDVDTQIVGFAGRCCAACIQTVRPQVERRGWND